MNSLHELHLAVAIPTRNGGKTIMPTLKSIYASVGVAPFTCIVVADSIPFTKKEKQTVEKMGVHLIENKTPGTLFSKYKQIISKVHSDILILTQDDVIFEKHALSELVEAFQHNPDLTLVGANIVSAKAETVFQYIIEKGVRMANEIGALWNNGDNYLLANGRCMAFKTTQLKKFRIPERLVNGDSYFYFENKRLKGTFASVPNAIIYNTNPKRMSEHINQAHRFQFSQQELQPLFSFDLAKHYAIPQFLTKKVLRSTLGKHPITTSLYIIVNMYSRIIQNKDIANPLWKTAISTKKAST